MNPIDDEQRDGVPELKEKFFETNIVDKIKDQNEIIFLNKKTKDDNKNNNPEIAPDKNKKKKIEDHERIQINNMKNNNNINEDDLPKELSL